MADALSRIRREGLSPRVRGNPMMVRRNGLTVRSIPACAGEPKGGLTNWRIGRVYPRVCGGTGRRPSAKRTVRGLSPRVRGNPKANKLPVQIQGSIPACAGEPCYGYYTEGAMRVYPRVCGGTQVYRKMGNAARGLSPRVRGNRGIMPRVQPYERSIPACAGEPQSVNFSGRW